ncbi:MAG: aminopeptidase P family protein [Rhodothermales bacterium]|nr:aminopeptidase P family protein [Rhodothermales bacterium]
MSKDTFSGSTTDIENRLDRLRRAVAESPFDAIVLNPSPSLVYVADLHFHLSERPVVFCVPAEGTPSIVLPELEAAKAGRTPFPLETFTYTEAPDSWQTAFDAALENLPDDAHVGLEPRIHRVLELRFLEAALPGSTFGSAEELIAGLRMSKDASELDAMQEAVGMAERALRDTLPSVRPGVSERRINSILVQNLLAHGSDGELPFQPIVAFGPNSADPHAVSSDYEAREGDLILIDWGAGNGGYFSDLTRTFALGEVDDELRRIHEIVHEANEAGRAAAGPGVPAGHVDFAAREVIRKAGYGDRFVHRTGHGLGLEVHEDPYIRADNDQLLRPGMTFTVEPGIYLPGRGGVRIEDDVVITEDGARSMSTYPRELRILSL